MKVVPFPSGALRLGGRCRPAAKTTHPISGDEVLRRCVALSKEVRTRGGLVVFVRVERPGAQPQPEGSELAVTPESEDVEIVKRTWGAFHQTGLAEALRERGITTILLGGIATNMGVESTGRAAVEHGLSVVFVSDAMAGLDEYAHTFAIDYMFPRIGAVHTSDEVLAGLDDQAVRT